MLSALLGRRFGRIVRTLSNVLFFPSKSHCSERESSLLGIWSECRNSECQCKNIFDAAQGKMLPLASWGGAVVFIYQCDNRPILITPRYASIICLCQADQACASQAPGLTRLNHQPIDYSSYLSHCMHRDTGGNRANGRGLKVTLFTSPMTGQYICGEIWAPLCPTHQHVCIKVEELTPQQFTAILHIRIKDASVNTLHACLLFSCAQPFFTTLQMEASGFLCYQNLLFLLSFFFPVCELLMWPWGLTSEML